MDYAKTGLDIQAAMVDLARKHPNQRTRPKHICWGDRCVQTHDRIALPKRAWLRARILRCVSDPQQGFDLKLLQGSIHVPKVGPVDHLRTWCNPGLDGTVEYEIETESGFVQFWNVFKRHWPSGLITEERMTGNAGFWIDSTSDLRRVYHCSSGEVRVPEFESLVVEVTVGSR
jgi:hypothetical protein